MTVDTDTSQQEVPERSVGGSRTISTFVYHCLHSVRLLPYSCWQELLITSYRKHFIPLNPQHCDYQVNNCQATVYKLAGVLYSQIRLNGRLTNHVATHSCINWLLQLLTIHTNTHWYRVGHSYKTNYNLLRTETESWRIWRRSGFTQMRI